MLLATKGLFSLSYKSTPNALYRGVMEKTFRSRCSRHGGAWNVHAVTAVPQALLLQRQIIALRASAWLEQDRSKQAPDSLSVSSLSIAPLDPFSSLAASKCDCANISVSMSANLNQT